MNSALGRNDFKVNARRSRRGLIDNGYLVLLSPAPMP